MYWTHRFYNKQNTYKYDDGHVQVSIAISIFTDDPLYLEWSDSTFHVHGQIRSFIRFSAYQCNEKAEKVTEPEANPQCRHHHQTEIKCSLQHSAPIFDTKMCRITNCTYSHSNIWRLGCLWKRCQAFVEDGGKRWRWWWRRDPYFESIYACLVCLYTYLKAI